MANEYRADTLQQYDASAKTLSDCIFCFRITDDDRNYTNYLSAHKKPVSLLFHKKPAKRSAKIFGTRNHNVND